MKLSVSRCIFILFVTVLTAAGLLSPRAEAARTRHHRAAAPGGADIVDLAQSGRLAVVVKGDGIQSVRLALRHRGGGALTVRIPVGTFFHANNGDAQSMVSTKSVSVRVGGSRWQGVTVPAACADRTAEVPGEDDTFKVQRSPNQADLSKLMPVLAAAGVDYPTRQAAVWIVTDNAGYDDMSELVRSFDGLGIGGTSVIGAPQTARAMLLCQRAGIRLGDKAIWDDRARILGGMTDGEMGERADKSIAQTLAANPLWNQAKDGNGETALHHAADEGNTKIAALLLRHQPDINARDNDGATPLHLALNNHHYAVAKLLRRYGGRG